MGIKSTTEISRHAAIEQIAHHKADEVHRSVLAAWREHLATLPNRKIEDIRESIDETYDGMNFFNYLITDGERDGD